MHFFWPFFGSIWHKALDQEPPVWSESNEFYSAKWGTVVKIRWWSKCAIHWANLKPNLNFTPPNAAHHSNCSRIRRPNRVPYFESRRKAISGTAQASRLKSFPSKTSGLAVTFNLKLREMNKHASTPSTSSCTVTAHTAMIIIITGSRWMEGRGLIPTATTQSSTLGAIRARNI